MYTYGVFNDRRGSDSRPRAAFKFFLEVFCEHRYPHRGSQCTDGDTQRDTKRDRDRQRQRETETETDRHTEIALIRSKIDNEILSY